MLYPVILVGGSGTRLWPLSRRSMPKQFLPLASQHSLLQDTLARLNGLEIADAVFVCNQEHRFLVAEQVREVNATPEALMLEPTARNTAPAIAAAALHLIQKNPDALMLVLPSDHVITDVAAFHSCIAQAKTAAENGFLVTFGIVPNRAETGYGYIHRGAVLPAINPCAEVKTDSSNADSSNLAESENATFRVSRFVEKPDEKTAEEYVASGDYLWNSGMFLFRAQVFLDELQKYHPEISSSTRLAVDGAYQDLDFLRLEESAFGACPSLSVDVAVMEKTDKAVVVPSDIGWSDLGSWSALWEMQLKDESGNASRGEVFLHDARNCYVHAERRLVAVVGVDDLVVVETADAVLVTHLKHSQNVKKIVEWLNNEGRTEHDTHRKVYRPWGSYEGIENGERFQVKRLIVKPGGKTSMQMHHHRSEHWVVVSGTAEVTIEDDRKIVTENESIYVPVGVMHRIHNPGKIPLHFIEVQSGPYLDEDDIVRTDDNYGR